MAFRVFGKIPYEDVPAAFMICNRISFCFYVIQALYSGFLLYRLAKKSPTKRRSKTLLTATAMLLYSSVLLAVLFGIPTLAIKAQSDSSSISQRWYIIMCRDLPFTLIFIAHQYIIAEYYLLALTLPVLLNIN